MTNDTALPLIQAHSAPVPHCKRLGAITMPTPVFLGLPSHEDQRDTLLHVAKLQASNVLSEHHVRHEEVAIMLMDRSGKLSIDDLAQLYADADDKQVVIRKYGRKLDGHTRAALWSSNTLASSETVFATVYAVDRKDASLVLYKTFDSGISVKQPGDVMLETLLYAGLTPQSRFFAQPRWLKTALDVANGVEHGNMTIRVNTKAQPASKPAFDADDSGHQPINPAAADEDPVRVREALPYIDVVKHYVAELRALDSLDLNGRVLPVNPHMLGAYLAILKKDLSAGKLFLADMIVAPPTSNGDEMSPSFVLRNAVSSFKLRAKPVLPSVKSPQLVSMVLHAYEASRTGNMVPSWEKARVTSIITRFNPTLRPRKAKAAPSSASPSASAVVSP